MQADNDIIDDAPAHTARDADERRQASPGEEDSVVGRSVTINRPRDEIYAFCRDFTNLQPIMEKVERIEVIDDRRSRWTVEAPGGRSVTWDSMVTEDEPGRVIAYQSVDDAPVSGSGRMEFIDGPPGRGTIVRGIFAFDAPAGSLGAWIAGLFTGPPQLQANHNLRRLKQYLETGEITSSASPSGRKSESPTEQAL